MSSLRTRGSRPHIYWTRFPPSRERRKEYMTKKEIEILATDCYKGTILDEKLVTKFAGYMDRKDLKGFVRELKKIEKTQNVVIALVSRNSYNKAKDTFESLFKDKHIRVEEDASLLAGVRIINNDMVYEQSLKNSFAGMLQTIENQYE